MRNRCCTSAAANASFNDVAKRIREEERHKRRIFIERIVQTSAYYVVIIPALIILCIFTVALGLLAFGMLVVILTELPWMVSICFVLVTAGLIAAYRGSEPT